MILSAVITQGVDPYFEVSPLRRASCGVEPNFEHLYDTLMGRAQFSSRNSEHISRTIS